MWLLVLDPITGDPLFSRLYSEEANLQAGAVTETADGGLSIAGSREPASGPTEGVLLRTDLGGSPLWLRAYNPRGESRLWRVWEEPDGSLRAAGWRGNEIWLLALDADGLLSDSCIEPRSLSVTVTDVQAEPEDTTLTSEPLFELGGGSSLPVSPYPLWDYDPCDCPALPQTIQQLLATKSGDDAILGWQPDGAATGYNVWSVTQPEDIPLARQASAPPAVGVIGCSPPSPCASNTCTDADAISRGFPGILYYQVRGLCGPDLEGP
jgi:hypothetical protein